MPQKEFMRARTIRSETLLKLFYAKGSIASVIGTTLFEAGMDFEACRLDFAKQEQSDPEFLKINPKGRVPALATTHGILTETGAILEYIASVAPDAALTPSDPWEAAKLREVTYYLASTMHVAHAHKLRGRRWASDAAALAHMTDEVPRTMSECCAFAESNFSLSPFVMGKSITVADPYLYTITTWLKGDGVDRSSYPKLDAFNAMMSARPSVQAARALEMFVDD